MVACCLVLYAISIPEELVYSKSGGITRSGFPSWWRWVSHTVLDFHPLVGNKSWSTLGLSLGTRPPPVYRAFHHALSTLGRFNWLFRNRLAYILIDLQNLKIYGVYLWSLGPIDLLSVPNPVIWVIFCGLGGGGVRRLSSTDEEPLQQ
jgi:hypothetical protein